MSDSRRKPLWSCRMRRIYGSGDVHEITSYRFRSDDAKRTMMYVKALFESLGVTIEYDSLERIGG